jgi:hypothetical protein
MKRFAVYGKVRIIKSIFIDMIVLAGFSTLLDCRNARRSFHSFRETREGR